MMRLALVKGLSLYFPRNDNVYPASSRECPEAIGRIENEDMIHMAYFYPLGYIINVNTKNKIGFCGSRRWWILKINRIPDFRNAAPIIYESYRKALAVLRPFSG